MNPATHISISINCHPQVVYQFASDGAKLTLWAAGLSQASIKMEGDHWICESPMGSVKVTFAAANDFGVMDHDVTLPTGLVSHNPFRVLKNGEGSEVVFTLYRRPEMTDAEFEADARQIATDLATLKRLLEN